MSKSVRDTLIARKQTLLKELMDIEVTLRVIDEVESSKNTVAATTNFKTCTRCSQLNYPNTKHCAYCGEPFQVKEEVDDNPLHHIGYGRGDD
jgi:hypothetical protein